MTQVSDNPFKRIVGYEGSAAAAAERIGVSQVAFGKWMARGWCSPKRAVQIEKIWGIPCRQLVHPDIIAALFKV